MTAVGLALVLTSAVLHATWNLLAKRVGDGGAAFVGLTAAVAGALYVVPVVVLVTVGRPRLDTAFLGFAAGSALLHLGYFLTLQRGYADGDLSVVYPLARGTGPLLATVVAILAFGERPAPLGLAGVALIVLGVLALAGGGRLRGRPGVAAGLLTGVLIAGYTLWDKQAVGGAHAYPPLLYDWSVNTGRALVLAPLLVARRARVRALWRAHRGTIVAVGALSPLAYILVLTALSLAPVTYVAPLREVGILVSVVLGRRLLAEGDLRRRLPAAVAILGGVVAIAVH